MAAGSVVNLRVRQKGLFEGVAGRSGRRTSHLLPLASSPMPKVVDCKST